MRVGSSTATQTAQLSPQLPVYRQRGSFRACTLPAIHAAPPVASVVCCWSCAHMGGHDGSLDSSNAPATAAATAASSPRSQLVCGVGQYGHCCRVHCGRHDRCSGCDMLTFRRTRACCMHYVHVYRAVLVFASYWRVRCLDVQYAVLCCCLHTAATLQPLTV